MLASQLASLVACGFIGAETEKPSMKKKWQIYYEKLNCRDLLLSSAFINICLAKYFLRLTCLCNKGTLFAALVIKNHFFQLWAGFFFLSLFLHYHPKNRFLQTFFFVLPFRVISMSSTLPLQLLPIWRLCGRQSFFYRERLKFFVNYCQFAFFSSKIEVVKKRLGFVLVFPPPISTYLLRVSGN